MSRDRAYDAVVVGAGPNGLVAAIAIARAGRSVLVAEAAETVGGGARTAELTLPGFLHDVCSSVYPLGAGSPVLSGMPLNERGLEWVHPTFPVAHPFDDGTAVVLERSVEATARRLGRDGDAYRRLMAPLVKDWDRLVDAILGPLRLPRHPLALARFGRRAVRSMEGLARDLFRDEPARALLAGMAGHSMLPLGTAPSAAFALVLGAAGHAVGWPLARGGAQNLSDALASYLSDLGGIIATNTPVDSVDDLPQAGAVLLDLTPKEVLRVAGHRLPEGYRRRLEGYRYGSGVFKVDWALDGPIPWTARECAGAGTVHVVGTMEEISESEASVWRGEHAEKPAIILVQQSLFDSTRAPEGKHVGWAYCHVPNGSTVDMTERVEAQVERFAPGFRQRVLARHTMNSAEIEEYNPNYVGGDINGGVQDFRQLFTRPVLRPVPYSTPAKGLYICSSSTPPGGAVHGMCGYYAARAALRGL